METKLYYSLLSGEIYSVGIDEIKNLDNHQVPLKSKPKQSCKKCFGRGYIGKNETFNIYQPCICMQKHFDFDAMKSDEVEVKTTKTLNEIDLTSNV